MSHDENSRKIELLNKLVAALADFEDKWNRAVISLEEAQTYCYDKAA